MPLSSVTISLIVASSLTAQPGSVRSAIDAIADATPDAEAGVELIRAQGQKGLSALTDAAKNASGPKRARLLEAAGKTRLAEVEGVLGKETSNGDDQVKAGAIRGLGHLGTKSALATVLRFAGAASPVVRAAVVDAVAAYGIEGNHRALELLKSAEPRVRQTGVLVLAQGDDIRAMDAVIPWALKDQSKDVRLGGIMLAAHRKSSDHAPALETIAKGSDPELAKAAIDAYAVLRNGSNTPLGLGAILADPGTPESSWTHAFATLRSMGKPAFSGLAEGLVRAPADRRAKLVDSLAAQANDEEVVQLVALLAHPAAPRVELARSVLNKMGDRADAAAITVLGAVDPSGRRVARDYLMSLPRDRVGKKLLAAASTGAPATRAAVVEVYAAVVGEQGANDLEALLADPSPAVRSAAALAIGGFADPAVDRALVALLDDPDAGVRIAATRGLAKKLTAIRTEALMRTVDDADYQVRTAGIEALAGARDKKAVSALVRCVRDSKRSDDERLAACKSLSKIKVPEASQLLLDMVTDKDPSVRRVVLRAVEGSR